MDETSKIFSKKLKEKLREKWVSSKELADALGITQATVSRYMKGIRVPRSLHLCAMAKYFGCSIESLIGEGDGGEGILTHIAQHEDIRRVDGVVDEALDRDGDHEGPHGTIEAVPVAPGVRFAH